jgi:hypothetical protein
MGRISFICRKGNRVCRHCRLRMVCRPRGLCWVCYYAPGVRYLYPSDSPSARRGLGNSQERLPLPTPTKVPPGEERVPVLASRAEAGLELWHPLDAKGDES